MSVAAVILAAGAGSRFNAEDRDARAGAKLLVEVAGRPLVTWAIEPALAAGLDEVIIVTGAIDLGAALPAGVRVLVNEDWASGQASSLQVGLGWCASRGHSRAVVGLGDSPGITAQAWRDVARSTATPLVFASYGGRRGHPVSIAAQLWPLLPTSGDEGARSIAREHPEWVSEVDCSGTPDDIDVPEDLERWKT